MIIMKMAGGLGNQFFQYACGLALAARHNSELVLDISWYQQTTWRRRLKRWLLGASGLWSGDLAEKKRNLKRDDRPFSLMSFPVSARLLRTGDQVDTDVFEHDPYATDPNIINGPDNARYHGYFNSEKYFSTQAALIRQQLTPVYSRLSPAGQKFLQAISAQAAISLHVRRGDYLKPSAQNHHGLLAPEYYQAALEIIRPQAGPAPIFVFSDDPDWCRSNLKLSGPIVFISGLEPAEDLLLMSRCLYNIIANSTFSWWGAWLNPAVDKKVIAPKQWLKNRQLDKSDLFPDNWQII